MHSSRSQNNKILLGIFLMVTLASCGSQTPSNSNLTQENSFTDGVEVSDDGRHLNITESVQRNI